jgi:hypothetical protein
VVSTLWELSVTAVVKSFESICIKIPYPREGNNANKLTAMSFPDVFLPPAATDTLSDAALNQRGIGDLFM